MGKDIGKACIVRFRSMWFSETFQRILVDNGGKSADLISSKVRSTAINWYYIIFPKADINFNANARGITVNQHSTTQRHNENGFFLFMLRLCFLCLGRVSILWRYMKYICQTKSWKNDNDRKSTRTGNKRTLHKMCASFAHSQRVLLYKCI